jgi:hypothetical protein
MTESSGKILGVELFTKWLYEWCVFCLLWWTQPLSKHTVCNVIVLLPSETSSLSPVRVQTCDHPSGVYMIRLSSCLFSYTLRSGPIFNYPLDGDWINTITVLHLMTACLVVSELCWHWRGCCLVCFRVNSPFFRLFILVRNYVTVRTVLYAAVVLSCTVQTEYWPD